MSFPPVDPSVLITGCSSGIGRAAARLLRGAGWRVFATARRAEDLQALAAEDLEPVPLDLADPASVSRAAALVLEQNDGRLGGLVNNAGYGQPGALEDLGREDLRAQFEVNCFGAHQLANALLPAMKQAGAGRVVNVSSVVGRVALPFFGAYSASKFALEALSDVLRLELAGAGIAVSIIEPGPIDTRFADNASRRARDTLIPESSRFGPHYRRWLERPADDVRAPGFFSRPPEAVARRIRHALTSARPRRRYPVTSTAWLVAALRRAAPDAWMDALLRARVRRRYGVEGTKERTGNGRPRTGRTAEDTPGGSEASHRECSQKLNGDC